MLAAVGPAAAEPSNQSGMGAWPLNAQPAAVLLAITLRFGVDLRLQWHCTGRGTEAEPGRTFAVAADGLVGQNGTDF